MDTKILLENGTNELEVLEFTIGNNSYGINVAKIKEIINYIEELIDYRISDYKSVFKNNRDSLLNSVNVWYYCAPSFISWGVQLLL